MLVNGGHPPMTVRDLLHSLRNSLGLISGHAQYLLDHSPARNLCEDELRVIRRAADKAARDLVLVPESIIGLALDSHATTGAPRNTALDGASGPSKV
jgi:hypothetical protein